MDYKEKYEQALERARQFSEKPYLEDSAGIVEYIFPELKESEDERIRKYLKRVFGEWSYDDLFKKGFRKEDIMAWLENQGEKGTNGNDKEIPDSEQKPAEWSEQDEEISSAIVKRLEGSCALSVDLQSAICWVENVKDRVQPQPKQKWSEEDEYHKRQILRILKDNGCSQTLQEKTEKWIEERLKSLRPQIHWKPSDEQMWALSTLANIPESASDTCKKTAQELLEQLKKLREE